MPTINTHYQYFRRIPTSISIDGYWGYGSKGANVVIPNSVRVLDENQQDVTDRAVVSSPTSYPINGDSCTITVSVCGANSTNEWGSVSTTVTVSLVGESLVLSDIQDIQKEGESPTLKFRVYDGVNYTDVPSNQVTYSYINGNKVLSNSAKWVSGVPSQSFVANLPYNGSNGDTILTCYGETDVYGYGVQGRTIYIMDDDSSTTELSIPLNLINVSSPTLSMSPLNRALYSELSGGMLKLTVQNDSLESDEETYLINLESEEMVGSYEFIVSKRTLVSIDCTGEPQPQVSGSDVNLNGLTFTARYGDGSSKIIPNSELSYLPIVPLNASQIALNVSYTDWGKYSHSTKNSASTTVSMPVYGINYIGDSYIIEPDENGNYPTVASLFEPTIEETLTYSVGSLSVGRNQITVTGEHDDSLTVFLTALGGIGSMELLTTDITWTDNNDAKVKINVNTDGSEYFHSSVRNVTSDKTSCNIVGTMTGNGEVEFTLDASGTELNTNTFEVKMPNGARKNVIVHAKLATENTDFPTSISVGSNREWVPVSIIVGTVEGCENCASAITTVESDDELSAVYEKGSLTLGEGVGTVVGETYTFALNGEEHDVKFLGKYSSASLPLDSKSMARGTSFEITPIFTSEDSGVPVHKSDMPSSWYLIEMSNGESCLSIEGNRVTAVTGKTATSTSLALMLNWGDNGKYVSIPSAIVGDVTVYGGLHTSLGVLGDCELSFNVPQTLLADHTYVFHSGYKWNLLEEGDKLNIRFKNGGNTVLTLTRIGRNRTNDSRVEEVNGEGVNLNTGWDIPVAIDNTDGRYIDSEEETYTKYEGSFDIVFSVSEDTTFNSITISADVHEDDGLEVSDYELLLTDPFITDLGRTQNLVTGGELEDDMPDVTDFVELKDDGYRFKTTPNIGSWNPTTGELLGDIVGVSFKSNTISIQKNNYYYINCIPLQYENYKYIHATLSNSDKCTESKGFVYKANSTANVNLRLYYDGHSGTIDNNDINPWELRLDKYTPYVINMGSAIDDNDCWSLVNNRNFIGFEAPTDTMTISIT